MDSLYRYIVKHLSLFFVSGFLSFTLYKGAMVIPTENDGVVDLYWIFYFIFPLIQLTILVIEAASRKSKIIHIFLINLMLVLTIPVLYIYLRKNYWLDTYFERNMMDPDWGYKHRSLWRETDRSEKE